MKNQQADLEWREDEIPVSLRFDDPYFSLGNGIEETRHVFLGGNDLPARYRAGFHIAELGFGTGLNLFAALLSWREAGQTTALKFTSFEAFPMTVPEMERALQAFPQALQVAPPILQQLAAGKTKIDLPDLQAEIILGDARETLCNWPEKADAWFLDGFSPAKNPELWEAELLANVAAHTQPNGTFATYTAAGFVRRGLAEGGFTVERVKGYARKRHMTIGRLDAPA